MSVSQKTLSSWFVCFCVVCFCVCFICFDVGSPEQENVPEELYTGSISSQTSFGISASVKILHSVSVYLSRFQQTYIVPQQFYISSVSEQIALLLSRGVGQMIPPSGMFQEIKNYLETNEHENTTIQSLWDITKTGFLFF